MKHEEATMPPAPFGQVERIVGRLVVRRTERGHAMSYTQLQDGTWQRDPDPRDKPEPVRCWYMRDNHTFRSLPLDVEAALTVMREERDAGQTYGMLCGRPAGVVPSPVHARTAAEWPAFEEAARPWLEAAVARSKPASARGERNPGAC